MKSIVVIDLGSLLDLKRKLFTRLFLFKLYSQEVRHRSLVLRLKKVGSNLLSRCWLRDLFEHQLELLGLLPLWYLEELNFKIIQSHFVLELWISMFIHLLLLTQLRIFVSSRIVVQPRCRHLSRS
jgi:hypothetical protein